MTTISEQKHRIRGQAIAARKLIPGPKKKNFDAAITRTVCSLPEINNARTICIYLAKDEEVETRTIVPTLITGNKVLVVPRVTDGDIVLYTISSLDEVACGSFGVYEPTPRGPHVAPDTVDLFIVPGLAFDRTGNRLGWGRGYYDRLLKHVTVPKIGLAFSCQIVPHIPRDSYDILMTAIVTEKELILPVIPAKAGIHH
jgi:5-formyltetrahydrofolate cyclo-ligase